MRRWHLGSGMSAVLIVLLSSFAYYGGSSRAQQPAAELLVKGPIVQNVQQDRGTLTWVTRKVAGGYKKESGGQNLAITEELYHQVELTNLEPGTRYSYNLNPYGTDVSGSFTTAPSSEDASFSFIVLGDTRTRHEVHRKAVQGILKDRPVFVVHTGDLVNNGNEPDLWDTFFDIEKDLLRQVAFYPTPGNHEQNTPAFFKFFAFPNGDGHHYSFDWGSAHLATVDSNPVGRTAQDKTAFWQEQLDWLQADLDRNRKPLVFVWLHHPPFTGVADRKKSAAAIAAALEPVLLKGRVAAVFSGHDHNYQHHVHADIDYVVTGGAGAPLYALSTTETMKQGLVQDNYVRVHVKGTTARLEAVDLSGTVLDSFEIKAKIKR